MVHAFTIWRFPVKHHRFQGSLQSNSDHDIRFSAYKSFLLFVCRERFVIVIQLLSSLIFVFVISKFSFFAFVRHSRKQASREKFCMLNTKKKIVTKDDESRRIFDECNNIDVKSRLTIVFVVIVLLYISVMICSSINRRCEIRIHDLKRVVCCARTRTRVLVITRALLSAALSSILRSLDSATTK